MWTSCVQIAVVMAVFVSVSQAQQPVGLYACGNGEIRFVTNSSDAAANYTIVSVEGASDLAKCTTKNVTDGMFELFVKPEECNVTVAADGMASLQFRVSKDERVTQWGDSLNNVTCNVTATGERMYERVIDTLPVTGPIDTVEAKEPKVPETKLVAQDPTNGQNISDVILGEDFKLCADFTPVTSSPYKDFIVGKCVYEDVEVTDERGCHKNLQNLKLGQGGFKHDNVTKQICTVLPAFRHYMKTSDAYVTITCEITYYLSNPKQDDAQCSAAVIVKKRSIDDGVTREVDMVLNVIEEEPTPPPMDICEGHVSMTIFYVVVAILALLLLLTIGLAVYFAKRSRVMFVDGGKENPAF